jgi:hypothetical protein
MGAAYHLQPQSWPLGRTTNAVSASPRTLEPKARESASQEVAE